MPDAFDPDDAVAGRRHAASPARPVTTLEGVAYRSPGSNLARATFVSQLIAERYHLAPQRERRRASIADAVGSYAAAEQQAIRRLPPGYRKAMLV